MTECDFLAYNLFAAPALLGHEKQYVSQYLSGAGEPVSI